ncbi:hypothetical protein V8G57_26100 [Collimonas sp. H4R21]|uniref:Uncharacterized protein n=1 Tax=Collimonas rhizosphaerae TaxID=3126357 RepID=A0ABU9Q3V7_9BURK
MWLDALKLKPGNILNIDVPGVPCVPMTSESNKYKGAGEMQARNTEINQGVPGVPQSDARNTGNTTAEHGLPGKCSSTSEYPCEFPADGTRGTPEEQHAHEIDVESVRASLKLFRFDMVQSEIDAGHDADELRRINNMAWEFMQIRHMEFGYAIKMTAELWSMDRSQPMTLTGNDFCSQRGLHDSRNRHTEPTKTLSFVMVF